MKNQRIADKIEKIHKDSPDKGYRKIRDDLERYYGSRFTSREMLTSMIEEYIVYYNGRRLQRNFGVMTPVEKYESYLQAAKKLPAGKTSWQKKLIFFHYLLDGEHTTIPQWLLLCYFSIFSRLVRFFSEIR